MNLPKVYEPKEYEQDIYALWEKAEAFIPKNRGTSGSYSIVVPPPNANANLHIGFSLVLAIEDVAARYHRMKGEATLLLPGADHAGFETQVVYEKQLQKEGKSRFDFTRDELYQRIWNFVADNRTNFEQQIRRQGASVDWSRFTFTLDEKIVKRSYETFKKMWDEGLIYRGERLVNFCTFHGTAFADIEVEYKEENSHLWHIRYPLADGSGELVVATTRPETMLGDTAVAVHPDDRRYAQFVGKTVKLPLSGREIPVITDEFVSAEFGTGAVKITPAHDQNDYDAAKRHDLPMKTVIDHEGKMTHDVSEDYRGLQVNEAREKIVQDLKKQGFLVKVEDYSHSVGHCYKCGTVIQPLLREQWFVDMQPLAKAAIKVLNDNKITFYPESKKEQLITYLGGLRDWNISRQIAWGIPIPAFQNIDNPDDWIFDERVGEELVEMKGKTYRRDPDVFDTWFSSSSWPYATLNFPDGEDFKKFYPLSLMETGGEILYPWVSRMIMLGLYVTDEVPFKEVYIHGYVMAEDGSKMSKSIGNVVDPMPVIDSYGSDALRMGILAGRAPAVNRGYDKAKIQGARNFCNKLWNIARFAEGLLGESPGYHEDPRPEKSADYWILSKLQHFNREYSNLLETYRFAEAYEAVYRLVWDDVADWYIEVSKSQLNKSVLAYVLIEVLKFVHPFAPFVSETIWQTLGAGDDTNLLITAPWPVPVKVDERKSLEFETIQTIVTEVRTLKTALRLKDLSLYYKESALLDAQGPLIARLAGLKNIGRVGDGHGYHLTQTDVDCWLDIDQETAIEYRDKLTAKRDHQRATVATLEARLQNKAYVKNAPTELVDQTKTQLEEAKIVYEKMAAELEQFAAAAERL